MSEPKVCGRCGVIHTGPPFNLDETVTRMSQEIADEIDKEILEELLREHNGKNSIP